MITVAVASWAYQSGDEDGDLQYSGLRYVTASRRKTRGYSADRTTADQRLARDAPLAGGPGSAGYRRLRAALA